MAGRRAGNKHLNFFDYYYTMKMVVNALEFEQSKILLTMTSDPVESGTGRYWP